MTERRAKLAAAGRPVAALIAVGLTAAAALALALLPLGTRETVSASSDGTVTRSVAHTTMLQTEGPSILVVLAVPVLLAALPLLARPRQRVVVAALSAVLLGLFVFVAILSVGVFFVPALIAAVVAAAQSRSTFSRDWRGSSQLRR